MSRVAVFAAAIFLSGTSFASAAEAHGLPGTSMSLLSGLPFAGLLLSIAADPAAFPPLWEHY